MSTILYTTGFAKAETPVHVHLVFVIDAQEEGIGKKSNIWNFIREVVSTMSVEESGKQDRSSSSSIRNNNGRNGYNDHHYNRIRNYTGLPVVQGHNPMGVQDPRYHGGSTSGIDNNRIPDNRDRTQEKQTQDNVKVSFVHDCTNVPGFAANSYTNKSQLLEEIEHMTSQRSRSSKLIRQVRQQLLHIEHTERIQPNPHRPSRKIAIYLTDGSPVDIDYALSEAQRSRLLRDTELYAVSAGSRLRRAELEELVKCLVDQKINKSTHYRDHRGISQRLSTESCRGKFIMDYISFKHIYL